MNKLFLAACAAIAVIGLAACGGVDTASVEKEIEKSAKAEANLKVDVKCPSDVEDKVGKTFTCAVTYPDKTKEDVQVKLLKDDKFEFQLQGAAKDPARDQGAAGADTAADEAAITEILTGVGDDPASLCDNATEKLLQQAGGTVEDCKAAAEGEQPDPFEVTEIQVDGDTAVAKGTDSDGESTILLVREGEDWLVDETK